MDPRLEAMKMAIDLYCCLRNGKGGGTGGAGMSDGEIANQLGMSDNTSLFDLLAHIAKQLLEKASGLPNLQ